MISETTNNLLPLAAVKAFILTLWAIGTSWCAGALSG